MCGILGVRKSWIKNSAPVHQAMRAMAWRGVDGSCLVERGDWYLGVARLSITDPTQGQPLASADGKKLILFNGTATNASAEWQRYGSQARTRNDAELALLRMQTQGIEALTSTSGHYALAVVDPEQDLVWLARDPEGEKPLFVVHRRGQLLAFASCVSSLRCLGLNVGLSPNAMGQFLRHGFHQGAELSAGEYDFMADLGGDDLSGDDLGSNDLGSFGLGSIMEFAAGKKPRFIPGTAPLLGQQTADQKPMQLKDRVIEATQRCATADVPVALCLSGGLDSSVLAAALAHAGRKLPAYQFCAHGQDQSERQLALAVATHTGMALRPVDAGPEILQALPGLTAAWGLPLGDPSILAVHRLAQQVAKDGNKVLLSGEGADELWLGYDRHRAVGLLPRRGLGWLPSNKRMGDLGMGRRQRFWRALKAADPYASLLTVSPPDFLRHVLAELPAETELPVMTGSSSLQRARQLDRRHYLRQDLLPKLDVALLAAGVEGRCPYLDPLVLQSAEAQQQDPRKILGKRHLRASFASDLPSAVLRQRKRGFGIPLDRWLREDDYLADILRDQQTLQRSLWRASGIADMLDAHRSGRWQLGHPLYLVSALELYLRQLN